MTDTTTLLDTLRQYRLLEPKQLAQLAEKVAGLDVTPQALTARLVERGWLTAYQSQQVLQGRAAELVLGSYVLIDKLGEGGMGAVFKARHTNLNRISALKVILKERITSADAVKRFQREIRAAAQLNHPNIVRAFDADEINGTHVLVMEYVEGTDLAHLVKKQGPLPVAEACDYVRQTALGLQHAFEKELVHRDIKPANLLLAKAGVVKILDFGLARLSQPNTDGEVSSTLTQEGCVMGTPDYIAPEQAMGSHDVDIRADLYSLGCTLYSLLTGKPPFPGGTLGSKLVRHQLEEPEAIEKLRPEVPLAVAAVMRRLMAKKPEQRFQTPAEAAAALGEPELAATGAAATRVVSVVAPGPPQGPRITLAASETIDDVKETRPPTARRRWRRWVAVSVLLLLAGLGGLAFLPTRTDPSAVGPTNTDPSPPAVVSRFALDFDGQESHVYIPDWNFKGDHPLTLEAWATPRSTLRTQCLMNDFEQAGNGLVLTQTNRPFFCCQFEFHDTKTYRLSAADVPLQPGRRAHFAGVWDRKEIRLYVDGRLQSQHPATEGYLPSPMPFLLGANPGPPKNADVYSVNEGFDGLLHEVRISRAARYTSTFKPVACFEPDDATIALYHCDEGQGDVLRDASGKGPRGIIKGARWVPADQPVKVFAPPPAVIDLLPLLDMERDRVVGKWQFANDNEVETDGKGNANGGGARLEIPYRPPEEYDLRLSFTRKSGTEGMNAVLVGNGRQFRCEFGSFGDTVASFAPLDGKNGEGNPTVVKRTAWLQTNLRHEAVMQVRRGGVRAYFDRDLVLDLKTDYRNLSLFNHWRLNDETVLGLGAFSPLVFHKVEIVEVTGLGEFKRPTDEAAKKAAAARSEVWRPLFNGRDFDGWNPFGWGGVKGSAVFTIIERDGKPVLCLRDGDGKAMMTSRYSTFRNYQLRMEYQWPAGAARNGQQPVVYHHQGSQAISYFEIQAAGASGAVRTWGNRAVQVGQIQDGAVVPTPEELKTGMVNPRVKGVEKPLGEWNTLDLVCVEGTVLHVLNGKVVNVLADVRGSQEDKDAPVRSGAVGFHASKGELFIRRIDIRPISAIPAEFLK